MREIGQTEDKIILNKLQALRKIESIIIQEAKKPRPHKEKIINRLKQSNLQINKILGVDLDFNRISKKKRNLRSKLAYTKKNKSKIDKKSLNSKIVITKKCEHISAKDLPVEIKALQGKICLATNNLIQRIIIENLKKVELRNLSISLLRIIKENFTQETSDECQKFLFGKVIHDNLDDKTSLSTKEDKSVQADTEKKVSSAHFENIVFDGATCDDYEELDLGFVDEEKLKESER